MNPIPDPAAMAWLDRHGAGERTREALETGIRAGAPHVAALGQPGAEMQQALADSLVAFSMMMELAKQLHGGGKADPEGLRLVGRFLQRYPPMRESLLRQRWEDPEQADLVRTLLARAQAAAREGPATG